MMEEQCRELDNYINEWRDGTESAFETEKAGRLAAHLGRCGRCSSRYATIRALVLRDLGDVPPIGLRAPDGGVDLVSRVMTSVETSSGSRRNVRIRRPRVAQLAHGLGGSVRRLATSPIYAAAATIAVVVLLAVLIFGRASAPAEQTVVRFELYAPDAASVALAGDFNEWRTDTLELSQPKHDGVWVITVKLVPNSYLYSFVVDGSTWIPDPMNPVVVDDGFGGENSLLTM